MEILFSLADLPQVTAAAWQQYKGHKIWAFHAAMGCGKTTFIHALCDHLQVTDRVSSPTFAIINEYYSELAGTIFHMDWYRLKDEEEALQAGVEDCMLGKAYCFIEWPEHAPGLLDEEVLSVYLTVTGTDERLLTIG